MEIEYDEEKNRRNILIRGMTFELARDFEWDKMVLMIDTRHDYGEVRFQALSYVYDRLCVLIYTKRNGILRVISLRKANNREMKFYAKNTRP